MGMQELFKEVMAINMMEDNDDKENKSKAFFEKLNFMELPETFNWAEEIIEGLHVKERGDQPALIWTDIATTEAKTFTYKEFAANCNKCLNAVRNAGGKQGDWLSSPRQHP